MDVNNYVNAADVLKYDLEYLQELQSLLVNKSLLVRNHAAIPALGRVIAYLSQFAASTTNTSYTIFGDIDSTRTLVNSLKESNVANLNNTDEITLIFKNILNILELMQQYALYTNHTEESN